MQNLNEDTIASYLKQNNDFFERNNDVLEEIYLSHKTDGAVSLIERQVSLLRDSNRSLKKQLKELVHIAKDNDRLSEAMHRLTLDILKANTVDEILNNTEHHLKHQFDSEIISIQISTDTFPTVSTNETISLIDKNSEDLKSLTNILNRGKPICGKLTPEQLDICFSDKANGTQSAALIPLQKPYCADIMGFVAIGSTNQKRFHISMGTIFLEHMGQIISHALARQL